MFITLKKSGVFCSLILDGFRQTIYTIKIETQPNIILKRSSCTLEELLSQFFKNGNLNCLQLLVTHLE